MAVKVSNSNNTTNTTVTQRTAQKVIKKYRVGSKDCSESYRSLKMVVPSISRKENISKLDVVLEAISYIQQLQDDLECEVLAQAFVPESRHC